MRLRSQLKRALRGTFNRWSDKHLDRYITDHAYRFNRRDWEVLDRIADVVLEMEDRRLTYRELTA